jgi:Phasin protein
METKGRRSVRASGATEFPAAPFKPVEAPPPVNGASEAEPPKPAELLTEAANSTETAVDLAVAAATVAPTPSIGALPPTPSIGALPAPKRANQFEGDAAEALAQSQAALARGLEALSAEMAGMALSGMNVLARAATKLLAVKTLSDAIEVNAGFTCSSLETLVGGSAKLSELGVKLAAETSQPLFGQFAREWSKAARHCG